MSNSSRETPIANTPTYRARPTVRIEGQEEARVTNLVTNMIASESEGGLGSLELTLSNILVDDQSSSSQSFEDEKLVKLGSNVAIYSGDEQGPREIFRGVVTGLEASFGDGISELVVLAEDALQRARMKRRTKVHENATLAGLARDLASTLSLRPVITGLSSSIGTQVQLNESDLAFVRRLLRRYDADLQVVGGELHVSPRSDVQRGTVILELYHQLKRARFNADLAHQATRVTVAGWNAHDGSAISGDSRGEHLGPGKGRTGGSILSQSIGDRVEHVAEAFVSTDAEAQAFADAEFDRSARKFVSVSGVIDGNPLVRVGTDVDLRGVSPRFDNTYYVVRVRHRFDPVRGYETDFEAQCAYLGAA